MSELHDQQPLPAPKKALMAGQPQQERSHVDSTAPLGSRPVQAVTAADSQAAMERTLPADQHELDLRVARLLLPALLRLATRRLRASEETVGGGDSDEEDA